MPHRSQHSYSPPPRVAAAAGRTPPSGRGRPRVPSPRRCHPRRDHRRDHRRASRRRSRRSRRRRRGTSSGRRVSRAHARSARVARASRSQRSKRPAPACRARAGSWSRFPVARRGREEVRRGAGGRIRAVTRDGGGGGLARDARDRPSGGAPHASSRGRKERSRRLGEHGATRHLSRGARTDLKTWHCFRGRKCPDGPTDPSRASVSPNASHIGLFSHFCDRSPWRRQSTGAPRRRAPTSRGR